MQIYNKREGSELVSLKIAVFLLMMATFPPIVCAESLGGYTEASFPGLKEASVKTYLIAGQSNADGYGLGSGVLDHGILAPAYNLYDIGRESLVQELDRVSIFKGAYDDGGGAWSQLSPGFGILGNGNRFGPELSFGYAVQGFFDEEIALIKYARGATSLAEDWDPDDSGINQYDYFLKTVENAVIAAEEAGVKLDMVGMIWMQGEDDSTDAAFAQAYQQNLENFITSVRLDLDLPDLEVYIGSIADSTVWTYRDDLWNAQEQVSAEDKGVILVDGTDLPVLYNDGADAGYIHYSTQGQVELGKRFASAATKSGAAPIVSYQHSCANLTCIFTDESIDPDGSIVSWMWDFGDGGISDEQNPSYSYDNAGTYAVSLTVTDNTSTIESNSLFVSVKEPEKSSQKTSAASREFSTRASTGPSGWTELSNDSFDSGWGGYQQGGSDAYWYNNDSHSQQGEPGLAIRGHNGIASSFYLSDGIDVRTPGYTRIKIEFRFKSSGMDKPGEGFQLQYYDGSIWQQVADFFVGKDFQSHVFYNESVIIEKTEYAFPPNMKIRFVNNGGDSTDIVYFDEIRISGFLP